jgi:glycosyltransferase involved in cell wall biosynthesis
MLADLAKQGLLQSKAKKRMDLKVAIGSWEIPPAIGGPACYIEELVKRLSDYAEVTLIVPSYALIDEKKQLKIRKINSLNIPIIRVSLFSLRASLAIKKLDVDIVHDNGVLGFSDFSPFIETWHHSIKEERKTQSTLSSYLSFYRENLTLRGIKKADSIIAISQAAKTDLIQTYSIPSSTVHVVPHGVDTDFFKPLQPNQITNYSKENSKISLLYVGSLSDRKNLPSLIQALHIVLKKQSNIQLLIVGDGDQRSGLQQLVVALHLQDNVRFLGAVSRDCLLELYSIADFVVLPSYKEGFGMTVLEGLACEKPLIMTPVGISDVVASNNLGVVAEDFTATSIADAIESALNREFRNLRAFVIDNCSWDKTVERTLDIYKQTLDN